MTYIYNWYVYIYNEYWIHNGIYHENDNGWLMMFHDVWLHLTTIVGICVMGIHNWQSIHWYNWWIYDGIFMVYHGIYICNISIYNRQLMKCYMVYIYIHSWCIWYIANNHGTVTRPLHLPVTVFRPGSVPSNSWGFPTELCCCPNEKQKRWWFFEHS